MNEHVVFVHAHPDDETLSTGGTLATLVDSGVGVSVVTCTRGEQGEVMSHELRHLFGESLADHREAELGLAMSQLGVHDFRFLGSVDARAEGTEPHRYRDSGMQWGPDGAEPLTLAEPDAVTAEGSAGGQTTLTGADLADVVADLVAVIRDVKPTAVVSYDERGGYGHPDHVRAHEAASTAALVAGVPFYAIVTAGEEKPGDLRVDIEPVLERKRMALQAYRTQLAVEGDTIVHVGGQTEHIAPIETFRVHGGLQDPGLEFASLGVISRVSACAIAVALGAVVGAIGTANHAFGAGVVALLVAAGFLAGLRLLFDSRVVAGCAAAALLLVAWWLSQTGPGGSVLVPESVGGYVWVYGLALVAVAVVAWPRMRPHLQDTMDGGSRRGKDVDSP